LLGGDGLASIASLRDIAPAEWEEAGIGPDSRVFGLRVEDRIVAVAGYERWSGQIAQLQVFCHPGYRRRGLAAEPLKAAISEALAENLLPQYRARDGNAASLALAKRVGFVEYGWMATVLFRLPGNAVERTGARDVHPGR
jgi:RimJ/RimL family protein N-acetyltransferase